MAQTNCPVQIQAVAMRIARLAADGTTPAAAGNMYLTDAFTTISFEPEIEEGEDFSEKKASGGYCISYQEDATVKWLNMEMTICGPDPEIHELLVGGTLITASSNSVGWAHPAVGGAAPNGVSIEVWGKAIVGSSAPATLPYFHYVFPMTKGWQLGGREMNNGKLEVSFTGAKGYENSGFGNGPNNDVLWTPTNRVVSWSRVEAADIPTVTCGASATPTQA